MEVRGWNRVHLPIDGSVWRAQAWHGHLARGRDMGRMPMPLAPPSIGRCARSNQRFAECPLRGQFDPWWKEPGNKAKAAA